MKRMLRIALSISVIAFLTLSLAGCPGGADAPKDKKEETSTWDKMKQDASAPAQPAPTTPEKK